MARKIDPKLRDYLEEAGVQWELRQGSNHRHLYINGIMVGVVPHQSYNQAWRKSKNLMAHVRRVCQQAKGK